MVWLNEANAARNTVEKEAESKQQTATCQVEDALRLSAFREAKLELQATARRAVDAGRHSVVREPEYPQQTATRLSGVSAWFAATTSSETQDQASDRRQSNASDQRRFRETRQTSKADYLDGFDASIHGPLHAQPFVAKHVMLTFARQNFTSTSMRRIFDRLRENSEKISRLLRQSMRDDFDNNLT